MWNFHAAERLDSPEKVTTIVTRQSAQKCGDELNA